MNKITTGKLYVSKSKIPNSGRGVFAEVKIKKGQLIERCPIIEIPRHDLESIEQSVFVNYIYYFGEKRQNMLLTLGYGSIYNHTETPNARYKIKPEDEVIEFIAIIDIEKDDEITVNYGQGNQKDKSPLWFTV